MVQVTGTDNIGNRIKECKNLKKKLQCGNVYIVSQQLLLKFLQNKISDCMFLSCYVMYFRVNPHFIVI